MKLPISALLACAIGATSFGAFAGEVQNTCEKPVSPNAQSSEHVIKYFNRRMTSYKSCIDTYVAERRMFANSSQDRAEAEKANNDADAAVKEYNDLVEEIIQKQATKNE